MSKTYTESYFTKKVNGITIQTSKPCHSSNFNSYSKRTVKYIVMHYTGNSKDTAKANANYFMGANRGASAHFFVDETSIWQSVKLKDLAWHCGANVYYHSSCRNSNSIGIEMCTSGDYKISAKTIMNGAALCAEFCKEMGITAATVDTYVLRHYDVTHKKCPAQMANSDSDPDWIAFKAQVKGYLTGVAAPKDDSEIYRVRKSWSDAKSQKGAFTSIENAKKCCDKAGADYEVYNSKGQAVYPNPVPIVSDGSFKVKVTAKNGLFIRKGPSTVYKKLGAITDNGVYTIVKTKGNWGLLKAGPVVGSSWICLKYTEKI